MIRTVQGRQWWWVAATALLVVFASLLAAHLFSSRRGMPYHDGFAAGKADEWKAYGGTWELVNGVMRNDSDERGAKLLTGSSRWSDYSVEADVMLLGLGGDAGLMLRSSDEEPGVDAYTGYYAGLRTIDDSVVIGRAGHEWVEVAQKLMPIHARASQWYHMKLLAFGCQLAVRVALSGDPEAGTTMGVTDQNCIRSGRAGLRSYASGGVWRHVVIQPATRADLIAMLATTHQQAPEKGRGAVEQSAWDLYATSSTALAAPLPSHDSIDPISALRLPALSRSIKATVRGTVVLTSPALFVQDATGGMAVQQAQPQPLKVGDEVEATGTVRARTFSSVLEGATVRVLWENTPIPPLSVTASQAATGAFDATYIEVEGRLTGKEPPSGDSLTFDFEAGPQSFRASMNRGRGDSLFRSLKPGSMLRLRGVAVADSAYTQDAVPFALLLRSSDDAVLLAGPPWWNARHAALVAVASLLLLLLAILSFHYVENWRLRAVLEERERMAYEMHDTLSQSFAGIGFQLKAIREGMPEDLPRLRQQLDLASELVRHSHQETRRSIAVLRPEQPGSEGLLQALHECANRLVEGGSVQIVASCDGEGSRVPLRVTDALYHIGQESLANAVRHGHPEKLEIRLRHEKTSVQLSVRDDGGGFEVSEDLAGFGLRSMRRRAAAIGATLEIESSLAKGTEVRVRSGLTSPRLHRGVPPLVAAQVWRQIRHGARNGGNDTRSDRG